MKWSRKIMAAVLAAASLMGMTSLSGCGSSNNVQEENPKSIKIWHYEEDNGAMGKAWKKAMDIFEKETGVKSNLRRNPSSRSAKPPAKCSILMTLRTSWNTTRATPPQVC